MHIFPYSIYRGSQFDFLFEFSILGISMGIKSKKNFKNLQKYYIVNGSFNQVNHVQEARISCAQILHK